MTPIERTISTTSTASKLTARSSSSSASSIRKQNRSQFAKYYTDLCHLQHSHPLSVIKQNLDKGILDFNCDRIKFDEWWSIINALSCDKTLHFIAIRSRHPFKQAIESADTELKARAVTKQAVVTTRFVLLWLVEAIKLCLTQSSTLTVLELEGLPIFGDYLTSLSRGIIETVSLQHLSLYKCNIGDEGTELVCHTIKNLPSVVSLDLSYCGLTERGAETIAGLIKYQKLNRYSEAWKQTLRYRDPDVEAMPGLRRITVNSNPEIGDKGMVVLTEEVKDDLWLRALDVQDCGLTDDGGKILLDLIESNTNLVIVDGRGNTFMSDEMLTEIMNRLALNNRDKTESEYKWISKNPNLNKKNFQAANLRPRPWTCQSSTRLGNRGQLPTERSLILTGRSQIKKNHAAMKDLLWRKNRTDKGEVNKAEAKLSEFDHLKMQLRDLTIILNQEVRHKLVLLEENQKLKDLLQKTEDEKKQLEDVQNKKVIIAEDTLHVLEETIGRFGMYLSQKQDEEEVTSESTTGRSSEDHEVPDLVSKLQLLLRKAASSTDQSLEGAKTNYQKYKEKLRHSKSETRTPTVKNDRKLFIDLQIGDRQEDSENHVDSSRNNIERKKKARRLTSRVKDQIIWEEEEPNAGDSGRKNRNEVSKSKAQAMFVKMLNEGRHECKRKLKVVSPQEYNTDPDTTNSQEELTSDDSDTDSKSPEIAEKPLTSSYEENSS